MTGFDESNLGRIFCLQPSSFKNNMRSNVVTLDLAKQIQEAIENYLFKKITQQSVCYFCCGSKTVQQHLLFSPSHHHHHHHLGVACYFWVSRLATALDAFLPFGAGSYQSHRLGQELCFNPTQFQVVGEKDIRKLVWLKNGCLRIML